MLVQNNRRRQHRDVLRSFGINSISDLKSMYIHLPRKGVFLAKRRPFNKGVEDAELRLLPVGELVGELVAVQGHCHIVLSHKLKRLLRII